MSKKTVITVQEYNFNTNYVNNPEPVEDLEINSILSGSSINGMANIVLGSIILGAPTIITPITSTAPNHTPTATPEFKIVSEKVAAEDKKTQDNYEFVIGSHSLATINDSVTYPTSYQVTGKANLDLSILQEASEKRELEVDDSFVFLNGKISSVYGVKIANKSAASFAFSPELTYVISAPQGVTYKTTDIYKVFELCNYLKNIDWTKDVVLGEGDGQYPYGPFRVYLKNKPIVNKIIINNPEAFGGQDSAKNLITKSENFVSKNFLHLYTVCKQVAEQNSNTEMPKAVKTAFTSIPSEIFSYLYLDEAGVVQVFGSNNSSEINVSGDTEHVVTALDSME